MSPGSGAPGDVRVLVVEDEQIASEVHADYVARVEGFAVAGVVRSAGEAYRFLRRDLAVDLVLLDLHLPDGHGLTLVTRLRAEAVHVDVVAVTSARDADVVRRAADLGIHSYLLKPFVFATFRTKLLDYAAYRSRVSHSPRTVAQDDVDRLFQRTTSPLPDQHPKGISPETMTTVLQALRELDGVHRAVSAMEVGAQAGVSRVTARRYLEYLLSRGQVERGARHQAHGRPELEYRLLEERPG